MRVLVTGAAGFIGSNLIKRLHADGHETVALDNFSSASWKNLVGWCGDFVTADLGSYTTALRQARPFDVVFHQASITDTTVADASLMMGNNVEAFRNILDLAALWKCRLVWASSASVYGPGPAPMAEGQKPVPLNIYAFSKMVMERTVEQYRGRLAHGPIGLRYFNVYGPGEDHKGAMASMVHRLARQMRSGQRPRIFTHGEQKRDFVYVEDVVQANLRAMECAGGGVFNVGSGGAWTFNEVVRQLNRVLKTDFQPDYFDNPYSFTQDWTEADLTESRRTLGYQPGFDLARGIDAYFASGKLGIGG